MIEIKTRKEIHYEKEYFQILKIKALTFKQLPKGYLKHKFPIVYATTDMSYLILCNKKFPKTLNFLHINTIVPKDELIKIKAFLEEAGQHLKEYNMKQKWHGIKTFKI